MSLARLWTWLAILLPLLGALVAGLSTTDLTYHLRAGAEILDQGRLPTVDTWTFTIAGRRWVDQQWAAQVVLALVERAGGWTGLAMLRAGLVGLTFGLAYLVARRAGLPTRTAAVLAIGAFVVAAVALALRPQLFGMVLFAATLLVVGERHRHPRLVWLVPLIAIAWANVHGSFVLAPLVVGLAWLADAAAGRTGRTPILLAAVVTAGATLVNPYGPEVWVYAAGLTANPAVTSQVTEWQPTSLRDVPGLLFFGSVAGVVAWLVRRPGVVAWGALAWFAPFVALGAYAIRGAAWWPLAAVAGIAWVAGRAFERAGREALPPEPAAPAGDAAPDAEPVRARPVPPAMRLLNGLLVAVLGLSIVAALPAWRPSDPGLRAPANLLGQAPSGITEALRTRLVPGDRILAPQPWGSWFEYAFPTATVAVDSRIELFPADTWTAYTTVLDGGPGWEAALAAWDPSVVVAAGSGELAFVARLEGLGWRRVYADEDGSVLVAPDRSG